MIFVSHRKLQLDFTVNILIVVTNFLRKYHILAKFSVRDVQETVTDLRLNHFSANCQNGKN